MNWLPEMKAAAEAVTPDEWRQAKFVGSSDNLHQHITVCSPKRILAMVAVCEAAKTLNDGGADAHGVDAWVALSTALATLEATP